MTQSNIWNLFLIVITFNFLVKFILNRLNYKYIESHKDEVPDRFRSSITLDEHKKAADYTRANLNFGALQTAFSTIVTIAILKFDLAFFIDNFAIESSDSTVYRGLIFFGILLVLQMLIGIPFELYKTFHLEEKFGFNKMTPTLYIKDKIKEIILTVILGGILLGTILYLMNSFYSSWWILAWAFIIAFQFVMMWAYPKFIAPLFNKFTRMEDGELKEKIDELSKSTGIHFKDYFTMNASMRSSHGNAYFTGFGKNKRIVLFDTLAETLSPAQAKGVLAHEMGHLKHKHIMKSLIISTVFMFLGFYLMYLCSLQDLFFTSFTKSDASPYMLLFLFQTLIPLVTYFLTPFMSFFSRKNEFEADDYASVHANANDLIEALISLYKENSSFLLAHPMYSKFYYSHPPAPERVAFLESRIKSAH